MFLLFYLSSNIYSQPMFPRDKTAYCNMITNYYSLDMDDPEESLSLIKDDQWLNAGCFYNGYLHAITIRETETSYCWWSKIDYTTGEIVSEREYDVETIFNMACDYTTETIYAIDYYNNKFYTLDLLTGDTLRVGDNSEHKIRLIAFDANGKMYGMNHSTGDSTSNLYSIDKNTFEVTLIGNTGQIFRSSESSMDFDRETNVLYATNAYSYYFSSESNIFTVNTETAELTPIATSDYLTFRFNFLFFPYYQNTSIANKPTDFVAVPGSNHELYCELSWVNPTTTVNGEPLNDITKIVVKRENDIIAEFENTAPGEAMSFVDETVPFSYYYNYDVYAINDEGPGIEASSRLLIGDLCRIQVRMFSNTGYTGPWGNGGINFVDENGKSFGFVQKRNGASIQVVLIEMPDIQLDCYWVSTNGIDDQIAFSIIDEYNNTIYSCPSAALISGLFFSFENKCTRKIPQSPTNLTATETGSFDRSISWRNPTGCLNGSTPLVMQKITLLRNDSVLLVFENPVNGEYLSWDEYGLEPGIHIYSVYATNEYGDGFPATEDVIIGEQFSMVTNDTTEITTCGAIIYDSGGPFMNYSNNETSMVIIYPDAPNKVIRISGSFYIDWSDYMYIYDGVGTENPLTYYPFSYPYGGEIDLASQSGALTLVFCSDGSTTASGFELSATCVDGVGFDDYTPLTPEIFPNPVSSILNIDFHYEVSDYFISITDIMGRTVYESPLSGNSKELDISNLQAGMYLISIFDNRKIVSYEKIIKTN